MAEEQDGETQGQGLQGAAPLLVSVAAGAAAGALAVAVRKALGGGDDEGEGEGRQDDGGDEGGATAFADLDRVAGDLEGLVSQLRSAADDEERDYERLVEIADAISEYADQAANAFEEARTSGGEGEQSERRVTDDLMSRVGELTRGGRDEAESERETERETAARR
jgi:hypothetical protein